MSDTHIVQRSAAEIFSTFCLMFVGTGAIVVHQLFGNVGHFGICAAFGLIVMVMIYGVGHISGAHMNPAVTIGFWAAGRADFKEVSVYTVSQMAGALLASWALKTIFFWGAPLSGNLGMTLPAGSWAQSFILEIILTFILMFVVMSVATDDRAQGQMAGLALGLLVTVLALVGGPISGASMNPVRSLAPAIVAGKLQSQWIYLIAPVIGSVCGALSYRFFKKVPV